ncbi:hypothetical protein NQZ71_13280 [Niallia taxi]|uniref:hypothetical protein n=1 Tax=Niallia taxi TaxID=2499688 RepID=UPI0029348079|nr:hypothetical protein [Niallia taxi]WOD61788.1 hypothetical protein NQZ71_13280 [Niallia taxi]
MQQGNIDQFKHLSQFRDIKDFNNNIEQWMLDIKEKFTKSELIGLKRLIRFCARVAGVSNAKIATVTKATHELDQYAISRSTFKRMVIKAASIGLLVVHETERKNGSQSSNVYVFNRFEPLKQEQLTCHETNNYQTNNILTDNIRTEELVRNEPKVISNFVAENFADYASYFFTPSQISELYRIAYIHHRTSQLSTVHFHMASLEALKVLIAKIKRSRNNIQSINGFFNGIVKRIFLKYKLNSLFDYVFEQ